MKAHLRSFGTLQLTTNKQTFTSFATDRARALLVYLAVRNRAERRDHLAGLLWPERPNKVARTNLRQALTRLRKATSKSLLHSDYHTVQLNTEALTCDALQFSQAIAWCDGHFHTSLETCPDCLKRLAATELLYQGDFLPGFYIDGAPEFEDWLILTRERLRLRALEALSTLLTHELKRGIPSKIIHYAKRQLALEPWHEPAQRHLMQALVDNGQRQEAIDSFKRFATVLADELAVDPEPETQRLYRRIMKRRKRLPAGINIHHHFPQTITSFVGRQKEQEQLLDQLTHPDHRLVTLLGLGGMGKTRLVIQTAQKCTLADFPDGVFFIPLAPLQDTSQLLSTIAKAVGLTFQGRMPVHAQLAAFLKDKRSLLVLDNFEHLVDGALDIARLLEKTQYVTCFVTSRKPLNIQAEWRFPLDGLPYASAENAAIELFVKRGQRFRPGLDPSPTDRETIQQICHLVNGLPLAIEMAAAWLSEYKVTEIAAILADSLDGWVSQMRDRPDRHQNMRAVFAGSWALLTPQEQKVFAELSVFRGSFSLSAATTVTSATPLNLAKLVEKSVLQNTPAGQYQLHELLRQFSAEHLCDPTPIRQQHAHYFLPLASKLGRGLGTSDSKKSQRQFVPHLDNIRHAWRWALSVPNPALLEPCIPVFVNYFELNGLHAEGVQFFADATKQWNHPQLVLAHAKAHFQLSEYPAISALLQPLLTHDQLDVRFEAYLLLSATYEIMDDLEHFNALFSQVKQLAKQITSPRLLSVYYRQLSISSYNAGQIPQALDDIEQALDYHQQTDDVIGELLSLYRLAVIKARNYQSARSVFKKILAKKHSLGNRSIQHDTLMHLGQGAMFHGEYPLAIEHLEQSLAIQKHLGNRGAQANSFYVLGQVMIRLGQYSAGRTYLQEALNIFSPTNRIGMVVKTHLNYAQIALQEQDAVQFSHHLQLAQQKVETCTSPNIFGLVRFYEGLDYFARQAWQSAYDAFSEANEIQTALHRPGNMMDARALQAETLLHLGRPDEALELTNEVLSYLQMTELHKSDTSYRLHLACYRVLAHHNDPRTNPFHQSVAQELCTHYQQLTNESHRHTFTHLVPTYAIFLSDHQST